ncbi:MAG: hypothetical protein GY866_43345, partial [Proteobacteria bacterium]|nr:hypothetical protein [Pseudomonadota bacterium]
QYFAFKTRKKEYLTHAAFNNIDQALDACKKEGFDLLINLLMGIKAAIQEEKTDLLWDQARDAPRAIAEYYDDRIVQIIDEFQYINRFIFRDKACEKRIGNLAGSYLHTCEYRNAPLLVSGSWVGWLVDDLGKMLPGRFSKDYLDSMPTHESVEMVYNYSFFYNIPVTEETACTISELCKGNPFYISSLFESKCPGLDLSKEEGVLKALEFETIDSRGLIKSIWMEYIDYALSRVNSQETKNIILYL